MTNDLKQSRIVIIDDDFSYLTRCAEALRDAEYSKCTPVVVFPYVRPFYKPAQFLTPEEISQENKELAEELENRVNQTFSGLNEEERRQYSQKIIPVNIGGLLQACTRVQPKLFILDTQIGESIRSYEMIEEFRKTLPQAKIIGASGALRYNMIWNEKGADAFLFKGKTPKDFQRLVTLVDQVLRGDPKARETLEGRF